MEQRKGEGGRRLQEIHQIHIRIRGDKIEWEAHANIEKDPIDTQTFLKLGIITMDEMMKTEKIGKQNHNTDQALAQEVASDKPTSSLQG